MDCFIAQVNAAEFLMPFAPTAALFGRLEAAEAPEDIAREAATFADIARWSGAHWQDGDAVRLVRIVRGKSDGFPFAARGGRLELCL
jgi:hypothetical protein